MKNFYHSIKALLLGMLASLAAQFISSACEFEAFFPDDGAVLIDYDPFALTDATGIITLNFSNVSETSCDVNLSIIDELDTRPPFVLPGADLQLEFSSSESGSIAATSIPGQFRFGVAPDESRSEQILVRLFEPGVEEAGVYSKRVLMNFSDASIAQTTMSAQLILDIEVFVMPRAQINLAGASGGFGAVGFVDVVDFGTLEAGAQRRVYVQVRSTTPSLLTFSSENRGYMLHETMGMESSISYTTFFEGQKLDLSDDVVVSVDPPRTFAGRSFALDLEVGDVSQALAGSYSDTITIVIDTVFGVGS